MILVGSLGLWTDWPAVATDPPSHMLIQYGLTRPSLPFPPSNSIYHLLRELYLSCSLLEDTEQTSSFTSLKIVMEVALEVEDDLFFADLSKQLSLLLMDDNEYLVPPRHVSLQAFSHGVQPALPPPLYEHIACSGASKGTGVFIPRSLQPTRKQRRGRYNLKSNRQFPVLVDVNSGVSSNQSIRPKKG